MMQHIAQVGYKKRKKNPCQFFIQFKMAATMYAAPGDNQQSVANFKCPQG